MTSPLGRRLIASVLSAFVVALAVHVVNLLALFIGNGFAAVSIPSFSNFFALSTIFGFILLILGGLFGAFERWYWALLVGFLAGIISSLLGTIILVAGGGGGFTATLWGQIFLTLFGTNLIYWIAFTALASTLGCVLYARVSGYGGGSARSATERVALVRIPASTLADGIVTNIERQPIAPELADEQWDAYVAALVAAGWQTVEVAPADDMPDSVFVEDAAIIFGRTAVVALSGAESRRGETATIEESLRGRGLTIQRISLPGTLEGGDVLQVGTTVYVGRSGRTNAEGVRQLRAIISPLGYTVIAVPTTRALHLKSAVTALPDGTVIGHSSLVEDPALFERFLAVPEPSGAHVVVLDHDAVLMASSAPQSAAMIADLGYRVVTVDISEFEKLEGSVTCLSLRSA